MARKPFPHQHMMSDRLIAFAGQPPPPTDTAGAAAIWHCAALFALAEALDRLTDAVRRLDEIEAAKVQQRAEDAQ